MIGETADGRRQPYKTADEVWVALEQQDGMGDGDPVDFRQHQLQTAALLRDQGADEELIVAGLVHDLGNGRVPDVEHSLWAAEMVRPVLGERVAYVVGVHADAKRYLCTVEPAYYANLSPVSQETLAHQGGLMTEDEVARFEAHPWAQDAVLLRRCDDAGKSATRVISEAQPFRPFLERVAAAHRGRG